MGLMGSPWKGLSAVRADDPGASNNPESRRGGWNFTLKIRNLLGLDRYSGRRGAISAAKWGGGKWGICRQYPNATKLHQIPMLRSFPARYLGCALLTLLWCASFSQAQPSRATLTPVLNYKALQAGQQAVIAVVLD